MSRVPMTQAVAADYADAMLVARRAKNILFFLLASIILVQMGLFFVVKYVKNVKVHADIATSTSDTSTSSLQLMEHGSNDTGDRQIISPILEQVTAVLDFSGVLFSVVLPVILLLIITIMLVGRLVGVSHVTSAFCWSIVFLWLLFPWQSLFNSGSKTVALVQPAGIFAAIQPTTQSTSFIPASDDIPRVRFPGTLYTFPELRRDYAFTNDSIFVAILGWGRFVGLPLVSVILLSVVNGKSSRGLRYALGEADVPMDVGGSAGV